MPKIFVNKSKRGRNMTENNEHKIVAEAQKIINDYINTIEGVYSKPKRKSLKNVVTFIFIACIVTALAVTFIKI